MHLVVTIWRTLVLGAFMFWQGGFVFYASAVVPVAQEEIGHRQQGFITRRVTVWINDSAILSLALLALDAAIFPDPRSWRRRTAWLAWLAMVLCQVALFVLHPRLDELLDVESYAVGRGFRTLHRLYLWIHTIQFFVAVAYLTLMLSAWLRSDQAAATAPG
jgi:hypothetical protein